MVCNVYFIRVWLLYMGELFEQISAEAKGLFFSADQQPHYTGDILDYRGLAHLTSEVVQSLPTNRKISVLSEILNEGIATDPEIGFVLQEASTAEDVINELLVATVQVYLLQDQDVELEEASRFQRFSDEDEARG